MRGRESLVLNWAPRKRRTLKYSVWPSVYLREEGWSDEVQLGMREDAMENDDVSLSPR